MKRQSYYNTLIVITTALIVSTLSMVILDYDFIKLLIFIGAGVIIAGLWVAFLIRFSGEKQVSHYPYTKAKDTDGGASGDTGAEDKAADPSGASGTGAAQ